MSRALRISAALAVVGAAAGAVGGALGFALLTTVLGSLPPVSFWRVLGVIVGLGAGCGVVVAPLLSWTFLREVPIWRCATETALVTSFAGIASLAVSRGELWRVMAIAALAAVFAVARLKWAFSRTNSSEPDVVA